MPCKPSRIATTVLLLLPMLACPLLDAQGGDGEPASSGPAADREVPLPPRPDLETVPRGLAPARWETWAAGQDVDVLPRFSLRALLSGGGQLGIGAGSGSDAPSYDQAFEFSPGLQLELGLNLSPAVELLLRYDFFMLFGQEWYYRDSAGNSRYLEFDDWAVFGLGLGVKLRYPFGYEASRLFRLGRAEVPGGLQAFLALGLGLSVHTNVWVEYSDGSGGWSDAAYFESGSHAYFFASLGLEYRWTHFGLVLCLSVVNLGTPNPSSDPLWAAASEAGDLVMPGFNAGFSLYF